MNPLIPLALLWMTRDQGGAAAPGVPGTPDWPGPDSPPPPAPPPPGTPKGRKVHHRRHAAPHHASPQHPAERRAPAGRSPRAAAQALYDYARDPAVRTAHPASAFGYRGHPNSFVRQAQLDMGLVLPDADGIYGPRTRARGQQLLGRPFPPRPGGGAPVHHTAPPAPHPADDSARREAARRAAIRAQRARARAARIAAANERRRRAAAAAAAAPEEGPYTEPVHAEPSTQPVIDIQAGPENLERRSPEDAASSLLDYASDPSVRSAHPAEAFGYKGHGNDFVRQAQIDMGVPAEQADGIYGPNTRALGESIIHRPFPPRPQA